VSTALITGASSGIGADLARVFARSGWDLILTARNEDALNEIATALRGATGRAITVVTADLSLDGAANVIFTRVAELRLQVDALVNNAGFASHGCFWDIPASTDIGELHVNIVALTHLSKLFLPPMIARRNGYVLNVASTAAYQPGPLMAVYYATKAYVLSLSEALSTELEGTGVSCTALCPGTTATGFQERAGMSNTRLLRLKTGNSERVARAGYAGMVRRRRVVIPGFGNAAGAFAVRFGPPKLVGRIIRYLNSKG
jgi:short-subunit dehydrogenase